MALEPDLTSSLARTRVPIFVAYGEGDDRWTPTTQTVMARRLEARIAVIETRPIHRTRIAPGPPWTSCWPSGQQSIVMAEHARVATIRPQAAARPATPAGEVVLRRGTGNGGQPAPLTPQRISPLRNHATRRSEEEPRSEKNPLWPVLAAAPRVRVPVVQIVGR